MGKKYLSNQLFTFADTIDTPHLSFLLNLVSNIDSKVMSKVKRE